jgi:predicted RNA binding protein YcfA (HicA-like mRNA interferase family)
LGELAGFSGQDVVRILQKLGFMVLRQRGSHVILRRELPDRSVGTVVPMHKELAVGTLRGLLRQAGIEPEEFLRQK